MSYIALKWAANATGLKPASKVVLFQLANFHNKDSGQCNPSAKRLAGDCGMGRATLFRHVNTLEDVGLITRHAKGDGSGGRGPNQYELHLDVTCGPRMKSTSKPVTALQVVSQNEIGGKVSECVGKRLNFGTNVVPNRDTNLTIEPKNEPVCGIDVPQYTNSKFNEFWETYPNPKNRDQSENLFTEAASGGADPIAIIAAAKAYAVENKGNGRQYIKHSDNWLRARGWENFEGEAANVKADPNAIACKTAQTIIDRKSWVANTVSTRKANELIAAGPVTLEQCKAAGVAA